MVRDHIAISMNIEPDDFDLDPFAQEGGLHAAYDAYGDQLSPLLDELNVVLADASKGRGEDGRVPTTAPLGRAALVVGPCERPRAARTTAGGGRRA